jgi:hypothetical protein
MHWNTGDRVCNNETKEEAVVLLYYRDSFFKNGSSFAGLGWRW